LSVGLKATKSFVEQCWCCWPVGYHRRTLPKWKFGHVGLWCCMKNTSRRQVADRMPMQSPYRPSAHDGDPT